MVCEKPLRDLGPGVRLTHPLYLYFLKLSVLLRDGKLDCKIGLVEVIGLVHVVVYGVVWVMRGVSSG